MPAEAHYCPGNPECTLIDEYGRHLPGEASPPVLIGITIAVLRTDEVLSTVPYNLAFIF